MTGSTSRNAARIACGWSSGGCKCGFFQDTHLWIGTVRHYIGIASCSVVHTGVTPQAVILSELILIRVGRTKHTERWYPTECNIKGSWRTVIKTIIFSYCRKKKIAAARQKNNEEGLKRFLFGHNKHSYCFFLVDFLWMIVLFFVFSFLWPVLVMVPGSSSTCASQFFHTFAPCLRIISIQYRKPFLVFQTS